jgi:2-C-methyl-D-erythritol 2,4-cyclodiphosphate synthase
MRIGQGFDVHALVAGRRLVLGGVTIPYERGLDGHSDADVLLHAIADALLGAAALGDLGRHFPDSDARWKDADSRALLRHVGGLVAGQGHVVANVDATIVAQAPKLAPYVAAMRANIAADLQCDVGRHQRQGHDDRAPRLRGTRRRHRRARKRPDRGSAAAGRVI